MEPNTLIEDRTTVDLSAMFGKQTEQAWEAAIDAVDYPVAIVPAFFPKRAKDGETQYIKADGLTASGRPKEFLLVVVDRNRTRNHLPIATVTHQYGTFTTPDIYRDLQAQIDSFTKKYELSNLYVSINGGVQNLTIQFNDMETVSDIPDELKLRLVVETSVDGTRAHTVTLMPWSVPASAPISITGASFNLSARHTSTIHERAIDFTEQLNRIVKAWNDEIIPFMKLMMEDKFDKNVALDLIEQIGDEAKISEKHRVAIKDRYSRNAVDSTIKGDNLFKVNVAINQYIEEEMDERPELQERMRGGLSASFKRRVKKAERKKNQKAA